MKTFILMTLICLAPGISHAGPGGENPYLQGTQHTPLTEEQRRNLLQYIDTSKEDLEAALEEAKNKSVEDAIAGLEEVINRVVKTSYDLEKQDELLMRYVLNQAMHLTLGNPDEGGLEIEQLGVLRNAVNRRALLQILTESIPIAITYAGVDRKAVEEGTPVLRLPFTQMANDRLMPTLGWLAGVWESKLQRDFVLVVFKHWSTVVRDKQNTDLEPYADELLLVDDLIEADRVNRKDSVETKARKLRDGLMDLIELVKAKSSQVVK